MQSVTDINKLARALGGVPVLGCIPGSPSHRAGIRYGDILLFANGQRTEDLDAYLEARRRDKELMSLVVFRDGREQDLELDLRSYRASEDEVQAYFEENDSLVRVAISPSNSGSGTDTI